MGVIRKVGTGALLAGLTTLGVFLGPVSSTGATTTVIVVVDEAVLRQVDSNCAPFDCRTEWEGPAITVDGPQHWRMYLSHRSTHPCFDGAGTWRLEHHDSPDDFLVGTFTELGGFVTRVAGGGGVYAGLVDTSEGTAQNFGQQAVPFGCGGPVPVGTGVPTYSGSLRFELSTQ